MGSLSAHTEGPVAPVPSSLAAESCAPSRRRRRGRKVLPATSRGVASYARYSSDNQSEESIEQQQCVCRDHAVADGFAIDSKLEFSDSAVSGTKRKREGLDALLQAAAAGRIGIVYMHSLSRLARESIITLPLLKKLVFKYDVRVISITDGLDTSREDWTVVAQVMALLHERYVKELAANVRRGQEEAARLGFSFGDYRFGYSSKPVEGSEVGRGGRNPKPRMQYVIDDVAAVWVIRAFHWFANEGRSISWIAKELTRRGAPKDHRASTPGWHHELVVGVLESTKYIGVWPWSETKNVRDPETGDTTQVARDPEESEKFTRRFEHLRIIDDRTFEAAQARLLANAKKHAPHRAADGTFRGSPEGGAGGARHLLQGVIRCGACNGTFQVVANNHMACRNYTKFGTCKCKTRLNRSRAERLILDAIGRRLCEDGRWTESVHRALLSTWTERRVSRPSELKVARERRAEVQSALDGLIGAIEKGLDVPDIAKRLRDRRAELDEVTERVERLEREEADEPEAPSIEWVRTQLERLGETLGESTPAAAEALRDIVGGAIIVTEFVDGDQRFLRGTIPLRTGSLVEVVGENRTADVSDEKVERLFIDFVEPPLIEQQSERAKAMLDRGCTRAEIMEELGVGKSRLTAIVKHWYKSRGMTSPDGRSTRARPKEADYERIAPEVRRLYQANWLIDEIAQEVGFDRETVRKSIRLLGERGEIEYEDGRTRRKRLSRKTRGTRDESPSTDAA